ncbi:hypothetical protein [Amycolatopsis sp. DSM 110486]|uniref:hypothetical protein n=1 Tax=Amycolatopsis sp. DSM 110486 TaxID=2865832 RepID=UPI001C6A30BB|nr:hypothetical protein [Amycolatopsis sp. DSM 110486]QYN19273.1 hypothetical protein K1T34_42685 [Amycolatopsis sp. DSM 110486]
MTRRPVGKRSRREFVFPADRSAPEDGEPWLPPGDDARPDGRFRVLSWLARRAGWAVAGVVAAAGVLAAGIVLLGIEEDAAARAHADDLTVYGVVVGLADRHFEVSYPGSDGPHVVGFPYRKTEHLGIGDRIEVTYDQTEPAAARRADDSVLDPLGGAIAYGLMFGGLGGGSVAAWFAVIWWRRRRAVLNTGWRAATLDFGEPGVTHATYTDGSHLRLRPARGLSDRYARLGARRRGGFLAGEGNRMVLLVPGLDPVDVQAVSTRWV